MKKAIILLLLLSCLILSSCRGDLAAGGANPAAEENKPSAGEEAKPRETAAESCGESEISNMADENSLKEVEAALKAQLNEKNVARFLEGVTDYNETVEKTSLTKGFEKTAPEYDMAKISSLWSAKKGNYIGTNCRINAFMLLKDELKYEKGEIDDSLLFLDNESNETAKIFNEDETAKFKQLFSKVKTEKTTDIAIHAEKMREHFSKFKFSENARLVSVILHDNLDGDYLFVGHVGVLLKAGEGFLFVEKLSFEDPYQALKFKNAEDCYKYLFEKYKNYTGDNAATPFIMDNGELKYSEK